MSEIIERSQIGQMGKKPESPADLMGF
jgi:hypothetical protein